MDTFCVLPWYGQEFGWKNKVCCLLPADYNIHQIKQDLLNGIQTKDCSACWRVERAGQQSRRQQENIFLDYKLNQDLERIRQDCVDGNNKTLLYQIVSSNLCNQACVICRSDFSSKWAEIEIKQGKKPAPRFELAVEQLNINYIEAQRINFLGGEPFYDSKTFYILEQLIKHNNQDCFISFITNGSVTLSDKQVDFLKSFTNINFCISIDGIESVFEYMRWPGKWNILLNNLEQYQTITSNISVSYSISSLNAFYHNQTVDWFKKNNLEYSHNIVQFPNWLALSKMPIKLKECLKDQLFIGDFCSITGDEISCQEFINEIDSQDRAKNITIADYLPEVWKILNN